jgi:hypothetical protein
MACLARGLCSHPQKWFGASQVIQWAEEWIAKGQSCGLRLTEQSANAEALREVCPLVRRCRKGALSD